MRNIKIRDIVVLIGTEYDIGFELQNWQGKRSVAQHKLSFFCKVGKQK